MYNFPYSINYLGGNVQVLLVYAILLTKGTLNVIGPNIFLDGGVYQLIHFRYILTPPPLPDQSSLPLESNVFNVHSFILALYICFKCHLRF